MVLFLRDPMPVRFVAIVLNSVQNENKYYNTMVH